MSGIFGGAASTPVTDNPPASGVSFQSSCYGKPVPLVFGRNRLAPNLLDYMDFVAIPHTSSQSAGGKGGGGGSASSTTYTYQASLIFMLCEGPATDVGTAWINKTTEDTGDAFTVALGTYGQAPWSYVAGAHPERALGYSGICTVAANAYNLGSSASLPQHNFEVAGFYPLSAGTGVWDADPRDIITGLLTDPNWGAGFTASWVGDLSAYSASCRAAGLLLSPVYESAASAASMVTDIVGLTNAGIYFSEELLKIVPYGDTAVTGHGVTYTPALDPVAYLTDDDYLDQVAPVRVKRNAVPVVGSGSADACNQVSLEYLDRADAYNTATVTAEDLAAIEDQGLRPMSAVTAHQIADSTVAQAVADILCSRSVNVRGQYITQVGWAFCGIEPTDIICLTDTALGLNAYPVRVLSSEEDDAGAITLTCEDAPAGAFSHVAVTAPSPGGYAADWNAAPGDIADPVIFEAPYALAGGAGLEVWLGVSGASANWGGSDVWCSLDGTSYQRIGTVTNPARIGHLTAALTATSTGPLALHLDGLGGQLLSGTADTAAALQTLLYVGGADPEFMAYQTAALTSANAYSLTGLVRGAYGSAEAIHASGAPLVRLDEAVVSSGPLDLALIGKTIHFKFTSFNVFGSGRQSLADVVAWDYTISGEQATGNAVSGLTAVAVTGSDVLTQLSWTASPGAEHYIIDQADSSAGTLVWQRTGHTQATTWADSSLFGGATIYRVAAVRALAGSYSASAYLSVGAINIWPATDAENFWPASDSDNLWPA